MTRRRILWVLGGLAGLALLALLGPYAYWGVVGLKNGECFYEGMPVSYWRAAVRTHADWRWHPPAWSRHCPRAVLQFLRLGTEPAVLGGDPAALPVLLELLRDNDREVAAHACLGLGRTGSSEAAWALVDDGLRYPSPDVTGDARVALAKMGKVRLAVLPLLCDLMWDDSLHRRVWALRSLGDMGPQARAVVPLLMRAAGDEMDAVRVEAIGALKRIDPDAADTVHAQSARAKEQEVP